MTMNTESKNKTTVETPPSHVKVPGIPRKTKHDQEMEKGEASHRQKLVEGESTHKRRMEMVRLIVFALIIVPFALAFALQMGFNENFRQEHTITIMTAILSALAGFGLGKLGK